jgi:Holliday junction DNA helicase RuvA
MIEYIRGEIVELTPTQVVIDNQGMGYLLHITLNTYQDIHEQGQCKLFVHEAIREDAYLLYGFSTLLERTTFQQLIAVSGVGANTARTILSSLSVGEFRASIAGGHVDVLKSVKGIGLKTAQRILVDLKGKLGEEVEAFLPSSSEAARSTVRDEAVAALQMLGYASAASTKVVHQILKDQPDLPVEKVIKNALKML